MSYRVTIGYFEPMDIWMEEPDNPLIQWSITIILPTADYATARRWADRDIKSIETGTDIFVHEGPKVISFVIFESGDDVFEDVFEGRRLYLERFQ